MNTGAERRVESLGSVLVASANGLLARAIGQLVAESGFTPAFPLEFEGPWLSLARTQPHVVICDADAPVARLERLIAEASSRRVPLLMIRAAAHDAVAIAPREKGVTWLEVPVAPATFHRVLRELVPPISARGIARAAADVLFFNPVKATPAASPS